jgi:hypothetical protein
VLNIVPRLPFILREAQCLVIYGANLIGKGGFGVRGKDSSTSWHNIAPDNTGPFHERPGNIPEYFLISNYSYYN